jgi:hypothetical protein
LNINSILIIEYEFSDYKHILDFTLQASIISLQFFNSQLRF